MISGMFIPMAVVHGSQKPTGDTPPLRPFNRVCAVAHPVWPVGLQKQLSRAMRMYERRIEWLSLASRRIWGTVCEKRYFPLSRVLVRHGFGV